MSASIQQIIAQPPQIRSSRKLRQRKLESAEPNICQADDCFNECRNLFCSHRCQARTNFQRTQKQARERGGRTTGNKLRGKNPERHIRIRVGGVQKLLHRHVIEQQRGCKLAPDEVVHHRDKKKHHNCFWKNPCATCRRRGQPNLEVLTGPDAHAKVHEEDLKRARRKKK